MTTHSISIPVIAAAAQEVIPETRVYNIELQRSSTPRSLREEISRAVRAGFNAILFPVYVNGYSNFPSQSARDIKFPAINPQFKSWDPVNEIAQIAHGEGINFWGLVRPYNFHSRYASTTHKLLERNPKWRIQVHPNLRRHRFSSREAVVACPVNREYRRYLADLLVELVSGYPIDGLVINYTGYAFRDGPAKKYPYCFCPACAAVYAEQTGGDLLVNALSPDGIASVRKWQYSVSSANLEYLRHRLLKSRRTLRLICRAQPQWRWNSGDEESENPEPYTLDWNQMIRSGAVEELLVDHDDETAPDMFRTRLVTDLAALHDDALLLPAIRIAQPTDLEKPLEAIRRYPVAGFIAEFAIPLNDLDADFIRDNYLFEAAQSPDHHPLLAAVFFLKRVRDNHSDNELLRDFMRDFMRVLEGQIKVQTSFGTLEMIFENLAGLITAIRRGRLGDYPVPETTMRDLGLARRTIRLACLNVRA